MAAIGTLPVLFATGNHASRPAASAVGKGGLYSCTTHSLVYQTDGSSWTTWATLGTGGSGSITASGYTQSTARLLGRTTASTGAIEEITVGSGLSLSAGSLTASGGSGLANSYLGYNTVGGSTQTMVAQRVYATQITAGGSGGLLVGIQAYMDQTAEAATAMSFFLQADSGSNTIGDLLVAVRSENTVWAHGTGGGISYPTRWFGAGIGYFLTASTKYWIGVAYSQGTGAPRLYYDGSGSDRYYTGGGSPYYNDGAYNAGSQTDTTHKHSIRASILS